MTKGMFTKIKDVASKHEVNKNETISTRVSQEQVSTMTSAPSSDAMPLAACNALHHMTLTFTDNVL